jgi:hypothetical protein
MVTKNPIFSHQVNKDQGSYGYQQLESSRIEGMPVGECQSFLRMLQRDEICAANSASVPDTSYTPEQELVARFHLVDQSIYVLYSSTNKAC